MMDKDIFIVKIPMAVDLLDIGYYRQANPDLAAAGIVTDTDLRNHFFQTGLFQNRAFNPLVNLSFYSDNNPNLGTDNAFLYNHLSAAGIKEGRKFSEIFDLNFYRSNNPDLNGFDNEGLFSHAQFSGINEGRIFSPFYNTNFYKTNNPDLAGFDNKGAFVHAQLFGINEGRTFSPFYDSNFYKRNNPDLAGFDNKGAFIHAQRFGFNEGRSFSPLIDLDFYRAANPDLATAFGNNRSGLLAHLQTSGINEGRRISRLFDFSFYRAINPDLRVANFSNQRLFEHFTSQGVIEGRRSSLSYDTGFYAANSPDLVTAGIRGFSLLTHFGTFGVNEGRSGSDVFNARRYLDNNPDLVAAGFVSGISAQNHFELAGFREGRISGASPLSVNGDPGNSLATGVNLGTIAPSRSGTVSQDISNNDVEDYYTFVVGATTNVTFTVNGFNRALGLQLIYDRNANGVYNPGSQEDVFSSFAASNSSPFSFSRTLGQGIYHLRLSPVNSTGTFSTNYNLTFNAAFAPENPVGVEPGDTLGTAYFVGSLGNVTVQNYVGTPDPVDIYRFTQSSAGNVSFTVSNLNGIDTVRIRVITDSNNNGQVDAGETVFTSPLISSNSTFTRNLGVGQHYLQIEQFDIFKNAAYTLNIRR
jgi:hypothetical protein